MQAEISPAHRPKTLPFRALLIALTLGIAGDPGASAASPPAVQLFDQVAKPEALDAQWAAHLCALLPQPCEKDGVQLFRPRNAGNGGAFLVMAERPLVRAEASRDASGAWKITGLHDFSAYKHSMVPDGAGDNARLSLAAPLYPLAEGRWAVAVLHTVSDMYSGGGAGWTTADFVPLDGAAPASATLKAARLQAGVPYSCTKMVRACFSEKEYRTSPHCHDENEGSLRIGYLPGAQPGDAYRWQYRWRETEWAAHTRQSAQKSSNAVFTDPQKAGISFCGGPP
jgi:hypothetical protein